MIVHMQRDGKAIPVNNIFCIGRNYAAHIAELGNRQETKPLVFLKPNSALTQEETPIKLPDDNHLISYGAIHYETELVLLINKGGKRISPEQAFSYIGGYGIGLDLTARDLQEAAKKSGWPWTISKGFDNSACVSKFLTGSELGNPLDAFFTMSLNGVIKQEGNTALMLFNIPYLINYLSTIFTLTPGDLIFTGTPEGVGCLASGDVMVLNLADKLHANFFVS